jgi:hypothetical protein
MRRLTPLVMSIAATLIAAAVQAPVALASHRCPGAYGIAATASDSVSCAFARNVIRTWVSDNRGSYLRAKVYSPVTRKIYTVTYRFDHGTVRARANGTNSWVRFWYAN